MQEPTGRWNVVGDVCLQYGEWEWSDVQETEVKRDCKPSRVVLLIRKAYRSLKKSKVSTHHVVNFWACLPALASQLLVRLPILARGPGHNFLTHRGALLALQPRLNEPIPQILL